MEFPHPRVYFTYTDAIFYLTDALVLFAVLLWVCIKISQGDRITINVPEPPRPFILYFLIALLVLCSLSIFWSFDWRVSLFVSLHFWLAFLLILSLREWHSTWKMVMLGLCVALGIEMLAGSVRFAQQSTAFLNSLGMEWPGLLDPSIRGASVVQLADGLRILRAYGTLPHPNILGGFALFTLLGPTSFFLLNKKANYIPLFLFALGVMLIMLTFSRSAWLGLIGFLFVLLLKSSQLDRRRLYLLVSTGLLAIVLTVYPLRELVFTRVSNAPVATEQLSTFGREWLNEQALQMFREQPLEGVGIGSFILRLSTYAVEGALIEPVHGIPLLVGAELGIPGLLIIAGLAITILWSILKAQTPKSILASAVIVGLGVIGLFDHYLWTLAPGRMMLGLAMGLWMGQLSDGA
jgi:O-antigen ligase